MTISRIKIAIAALILFFMSPSSCQYNYSFELSTRAAVNREHLTYYSHLFCPAVALFLSQYSLLRLPAYLLVVFTLEIEPFGGLQCGTL